MIILFPPHIYISGRWGSKPPTSRSSSIGTLIPMNINRHPTQDFLSREIFAFYIITSQVILCYFDKFSMFTYSSFSCLVYHKASSLLQKLNVGESRRHHSTRISSSDVDCHLLQSLQFTQNVWWQTVTLSAALSTDTVKSDTYRILSSPVLSCSQVPLPWLYPQGMRLCWQTLILVD